MEKKRKLIEGAELLKDLERFGYTDLGAFQALYGEDMGRHMYNRVITARAAQFTDSKQVRQRLLSGELTLSDVPILEKRDRGKTDGHDLKALQRSRRNSRYNQHFMITGEAVGRPNPTGTEEQAGHLAKGQSAALSNGLRHIILNNVDALPEELAHILTEQAEPAGESWVGQAIAASRGAPDGVDYYGAGSPAERRAAMAILHAEAARLGYDLARDQDRSKFFNDASAGKFGDLEMFNTNSGNLLKGELDRLSKGAAGESLYRRMEQDLQDNELWRMVQTDSESASGNDETKAAAKGGEAGSNDPSGAPAEKTPKTRNEDLANYRGPRIVINPSTFRNKKDALCVAFNEAFRLVMEEMEFDPVAEPTEAQRKFFSDTAYRNDELQLRRTILARICTFDTSVKDPTDEQLQEAVEFLTSVMEAGAPQNEWEQRAVMRLRDVIAKVAEKGVRNAGTPDMP